MPSPAELAVDAELESDDFEFIELVNVSDQSVDLAAVRFIQQSVNGENVGVDFDFATSPVQTVEPGERIVVLENPDAFALRYSEDVRVAGAWQGRLSNNSELLTLVAGTETIQQFAYDDTWHPQTDGRGATLEITNATDIVLENWGKRDGWRSSPFLNGSPGKFDEPLIGDSNRDGVFDSDDLVAVFVAGQYEDGVANNSRFETGDWNRDGDFDSEDFVFAFSQGHYDRRH